jgi:hypothetical protein
MTRAKAPKDGVKVTPRTAAMMTLAAAEMGTTVAAMTERACLGLLKHEVKTLFARELAEANRQAEANHKPTIHAHEFETTWKPPAWKP